MSKESDRSPRLLVAKSSSFGPIASSAQTILHIVQETGMHASYCESWGVSRDELLATPESVATSAYTTYLLDCGLRGDDLTLIVALLACLLGYGEVGLWLKRMSLDPSSGIRTEGNPYQK
ncbi:hypothetical protein FRB99_007220 [Tulasnella sp. 403]|nr:hypothetical protein FRB99_007220 [Tulasnella sp. 403]